MEQAGGTENVAGIVGLGRAAELAQAEMASEAERVRELRDRLEQGIAEKIPNIMFNGHASAGSGALQRLHQVRRG